MRASSATSFASDASVLVLRMPILRNPAVCSGFTTCTASPAADRVLLLAQIHPHEDHPVPSWIHSGHAGTPGAARGTHKLVRHARLPVRDRHLLMRGRSCRRGSSLRYEADPSSGGALPAR